MDNSRFDLSKIDWGKLPAHDPDNALFDKDAAPLVRHTVFSPCRKYRYQLWRAWDMHNTTYVQFIGLNPSIADETQDDPTLRRCIDFAKRWGYGSLCMTNLFAFVSTDPDRLQYIPEPVGEFNPGNIVGVASQASRIVACWGRGFQKGAGDMCRALLLTYQKDLYHLGLNFDGSPKHPLYLKKTAVPTLWTQS
jgi:hypothetical protein